MSVRPLFNSTGKRIKILRSDLNMNQAELADAVSALGVHLAQTTLSRFEQDKTAPPADVLAGLARALDTSADYLALLTDDPLPRAEVNDQRILMLQEAASTAYEVDRDVERLLQMWAELDAEKRAFVLEIAARLQRWNMPRVIGGEP